MATQVDFSVVRYADGTLSVNIAPATSIAGWALRFEAQHRAGGLSGLITKVSASGYGGGQSGITVTDSGNGRFNIAINGIDTSGLDPGSYSYSVQRTDSGSRTMISEGFLNILPDGRA